MQRWLGWILAFAGIANAEPLIPPVLAPAPGEVGVHLIRADRTRMNKTFSPSGGDAAKKFFLAALKCTPKEFKGNCFCPYTDKEKKIWLIELRSPVPGYAPGIYFFEGPRMRRFAWIDPTIYQTDCDDGCDGCEYLATLPSAPKNQSQGVSGIKYHYEDKRGTVDYDCKIVKGRLQVTGKKSKNLGP